MVIRKSNIGAALAAGQTSAAKLGTPAGSAPRGAGRLSGDQVRISGRAAQVSIDSSRLSRLQALIDAGTYQVSPQAVASSVIRETLMT